MHIKTLDKVGFDVLCYSRTPFAHAISKEVEWFSDDNEIVIGIVLLDLVDSDWLWII